MTRDVKFRLSLVAVLFAVLSFVFGWHEARKVNAQSTVISVSGNYSPMLHGVGAPSTWYACNTSYEGMPYYQDNATLGSALWFCRSGTWNQNAAAPPTILGSTTSFGGSVLLLGGSVSSSATVTGATVGSNCIATRADGTLLPVGLIIDCAVSTTNTATVRISAAIAGTPPAGVYNVRVVL